MGAETGIYEAGRRKFVAAAAAGVASAALLIDVSLSKKAAKVEVRRPGLPVPKPVRDAGALSISSFQGLTDTVFYVTTAAGQSTRFKLNEVVDLNPRTGGKRTQAFSILLQSAEVHSLPQGIYNISNSQLGQHALFCVPTGSTGRLLEIIFT